MNKCLFLLLALCADTMVFSGCTALAPKHYTTSQKGNAVPLEEAEALDSRFEISPKWQQYRIGNDVHIVARKNTIFVTPSDKWEPYGIPPNTKEAFWAEVPHCLEIRIEDFEFFSNANMHYGLSPNICASILKETSTYGHKNEITQICAETDLHPISACALHQQFKTLDGIRKNLNFPPKYEEIHVEVSIGYCMDYDIKTWRLANGTSFDGRWLSVNKDGDLIRIYPSVKIANGDQGLVFTISSLHKECQDRVVAKIREFKENGRNVWFNGFYISEANRNGIIKASKLVKEKSSATSFAYYNLFQVFSTWGGLARFSNRDVFFLDENIQGVAADGEEFWWRDLYWASTYTYRNRLGNVVTVPCFSPNLGRAINRVRSALSMYDETDPLLGTKKSQITEPKRKTSSPSSDVKLASSGTGFFVTKDGYLLTNFHVIENATKLEIVAGSPEERRVFEATVVDSDKAMDLALLKVSVTNAPFLSLSPINAKLGKTVYAVGFPMPDIQGYEVKLTKGVISGMKGYEDNTRYYQTDAPLQHGNSGSPLCEKDGAVVGVCTRTLEYANNGNQVVIPQNVNYAIKNTFVRAFLDSTPACKYTLKEEESDNKAEYDEASTEQMVAATVLVQVYK